MRTHDDVRHDTTTLLAAPGYPDGKIFGPIASRHTHVEWPALLKKIDRQTPPGLDLLMIADNRSRHKRPKVRQWLAKHPRFQNVFRADLRFRLNLVARFLRDLTVDAIRGVRFSSVRELTAMIETDLAQRNFAPEPCQRRPKRRGHPRQNAPRPRSRRPVGTTSHLCDSTQARGALGAPPRRPAGRRKHHAALQHKSHQIRRSGIRLLGKSSD